MIMNESSKTVTTSTGQARPARTPATSAPANANGNTERSPASRWSKALVKGGFTPVSNFFLEFANELRPEITHGEAMFVIQLMFNKWDEKMPYPAFKSIAKRMGIGDGQARKLAVALETKGYLIRKLRKNNTNKFDLRPLFRALEKLRAIKIKERATEAAKRKGPRPL